MAEIKLSQDIIEILRCPRCKSTLIQFENQFQCINQDCALNFPILNGIPVLINDENSIFPTKQLIRQSKVLNVIRKGHLRSSKDSSRSRGEDFVKWAPEIGKNIKANRNIKNFVTMLLETSSSPKLLVIGGRTSGPGMESIYNENSIKLIETDVFLGPSTGLICDAHDIPFENQSLDGVIIKAVLEHVVNPYRCVDEIHRVLNENGLVYAETAFMQQVHGGRFDFTRFTFLGHRRLFRNFEEIDSGATCGPGMALTWSYQYFLTSLTKSNSLRKLLLIFSKFTSFFLKYIDYLIIDNPSSLDAASAYYFMGKRSNFTLPDQELIKVYRGAQL